MNPALFVITLLASFQSAAVEADRAPIDPDSVRLSVQNQALLRCSAAFALVSFGQENGNQAALAWPRLDPQGREFFVRAMASLMDDTGLDRELVSQLASREAQRLLDENQVDTVMPACLALLDTSGL